MHKWTQGSQETVSSPEEIAVLRSHGLSRRKETVLIVILSLCLLWFGILAFRLNQKKNFSIDEFQYAHASWLIHQGYVPYKDFFEVHFPLIYQYASLAWFFMDDQPQNIRYLRSLMLPVLALTLISLFTISASGRRVIEGLGSALALTACLPFMAFATEIRPDPLAFSLYAAAIAILCPKHISRPLKAALSGLFFLGALWSSQKAWIYGFPFWALLARDFWAARKNKHWRDSALGDPRYFLLGFLAGCLPVVLYLALTGLWKPFFDWTVGWAFEYQQRYPLISWQKILSSFIRDYWYYVPLALFGLAVSLCPNFRRSDRPLASAPRAVDYLLPASLLTSFISFVAQRAPWYYSLIPVLGFLAIYVSKGYFALFRALVRTVPSRIGKNSLAALCPALLIVFSANQAVRISQRLVTDNPAQLKVLKTIDELTAPTDAVYDNSGSYVARPHAYFYYYTEQSIRLFDAARLLEEVPKAIARTEAMLVIKDARYGHLPEPLKDYLESHFLPYSGDLLLWGREFSGAEEQIFTANKSGEYFVYRTPPSSGGEGVVSGGPLPDLRIDGITVSGALFYLEKGEHKIAAVANKESYAILWLPRNEKTWAPKKNAKATFSSIF